MINKDQMIAAVGFLAFGAVALFLLQYSGMDAEFLNGILSETISSTLEQGMPLKLGYLLAGLFVLPVSFAFVAVYALYRNELDPVLLGAGFVLMLFSLLFIGVSLAGAAIGISLLASTFLLQYLAIDDAKEYKELQPSRIARGAASSVMLLTSVLVAAAVFMELSNDTSYSNKGIDGIVDMTIKMTVDQETLRAVEATPGGMQMMVDKVKSIKLIVLLKTYYAQMSAVTAFAFVQVLGILIAPLTGLYASALWKMGKIEK